MCTFASAEANTYMMQLEQYMVNLKMLHTNMQKTMHYHENFRPQWQPRCVCRPAYVCTLAKACHEAQKNHRNNLNLHQEKPPMVIICVNKACCINEPQYKCLQSIMVLQEARSCHFTHVDLPRTVPI